MKGKAEFNQKMFKVFSSKIIFFKSEAKRVAKYRFEEEKNLDF